ncbi:uncharacterized protein LOC114183120 [Vigna unguiculata]|uniref:uncharacterized protein LOC114183120 n=1 Tax=Vigna unguiculata TaxID=3917 RepID=UPI00101661DF|nr:uncharacterized protein LOC114183120 [Vigna unguiculata]
MAISPSPLAAATLGVMNLSRSPSTTNDDDLVNGLSNLLKSIPDKGISGDDVDILKRKNASGTNTYPRRKRFLWEFLQDLTLIILVIAAVVSLVLGIKTVVVAFLGVLVYYGDELWEMFGYEEHPYRFYTTDVLAIVLVGLLYGFFILRANVPPDRWWLRLKFQFLVARDHAFIFIIVQLVVAFLGVLVYKFYGDELREMFSYEEHPFGFDTMAVLAIVLVGLLYGFFIAILCGQRINERHYHVLAKQESTKEYVVKDREHVKNVPLVT